MSSYSARKLIKECEAAGWSLDRYRGDHYIMTKDGAARPIVIPLVKDLDPRIVSQVRRQLGAYKKGKPRTSKPKPARRESKRR